MKKIKIPESIPVLAVFLIFLAGCQLDSGKPELSKINTNSKEAWAGFEITAKAVYSDPGNPGSVKWKWTLDGETVSRTNTYTPLSADAGKKLAVSAVPSSSTEGYSKNYSFGKVQTVSDSPSGSATLTVGYVGKLDGKFLLAEKNPGQDELTGFYEISEKAYNKIAPLYEANVENSAIDLFSFEFDTAGNDIERIELSVKDESPYKGKSGNHYKIAIPGPIGISADSDYWHRTKVFLTDSESDSFTDITIETGGFLFIEYTADPGSLPDPIRQNYSGLLRVKAGGMILDDGSGFGGYTAGLDSHYWFDYNSIVYLVDPTDPIHSNEPFIAPQGFPADYIYNTWLPNDWGRESFIWTVNGAFLLHGKITQTNAFYLTAPLKLAPGAEFEINISAAPPLDALYTEGMNIAQWLPDASTATPEDYLDELLDGNGSGLNAKAKIILTQGTITAQSPADFPALDSLLGGTAPYAASQTWTWDPTGSQVISPMDNTPTSSTGGWL